MIADLSVLRQRIGDSVSGVDGLNHFGYAPDRIEPPVFFPHELSADRTASGERTFLNTRGYVMTALLLTSTADDKTGQDLLSKYLSEGGTLDVISAIEADVTLGGLCDTLIVDGWDGYRLYTVGAGRFYGARLRIRIIG